MSRTCNVALVLFALRASTAGAETYHARVLHTEPYIESACAPTPASVQSIVYDASNTVPAIESHAAWGTPLSRFDDMGVEVKVAPFGETIDLLLDGSRFESSPLAGHVLQSLTFWPCKGGLRLSFDSKVMDAPDPSSIVDFGIRGTVMLEPPAVLLDPVNHAVLVQWFGIPEPPEVPSATTSGGGLARAIVAWNLYRVEGEQVKFVTFVYNDRATFSVVVPGSARTDLSFRETSVRYGVVPVFRTNGLTIGPQGMGMELQDRGDPSVPPSEQSSRPMLVLSEPITF